MDETNDRDRALGRIESKVDILVDRSINQNDRISNLEASRSWVRGVVAVMAVAWIGLLRLVLGDK